MLCSVLSLPRFGLKEKAVRLLDRSMVKSTIVATLAGDCVRRVTLDLDPTDDPTHVNKPPPSPRSSFASNQSFLTRKHEGAFESLLVVDNVVDNGAVVVPLPNLAGRC